MSADAQIEFEPYISEQPRVTAEVIDLEQHIIDEYMHFTPDEVILSALSARHMARLAQAQMRAVREGCGTWQDNVAWLQVYHHALYPNDEIDRPYI